MDLETLLVIQGYYKATERIARHWPWYEKSGCGIVGVEPKDGHSCSFPQSKVMGIHYSSVSDGYVCGDRLPRLLVECFQVGLEYQQWENICVIENDSIFVRPLPPHPGGCLLATHGAGPAPGFHGSCAWHTPWWADRETAEKIVDYGGRMLKADLLERGFPDRFLSLMTDLYGITVRPAPAFSCNLIDTPELLAAARWAIGPQNPSPVCYVHGIKTAEQLEAVTKGLL